ncbi:HupE/UreJ family protein [Microbaculum marinum]|uniref:HupE/UreJ family protein n=1 Tax=Microbaculum marinum TaxID=1764581 RepID=A0AAW9RQM3_9HYPH
MVRTLLLSFFVIAISLAPEVANAHTGTGMSGGFVSGFAHPILGWDHVVAMVAVGMWGAFLGAPAIWLLPIVFPLVMAIGTVMGIAGVPIPGIETGIAASAIVLGLLILLAIRLPLWIACIIVGGFAIFHGYAHGTELPQSANPLAFIIGFVLATGMLHLIGIAFGLLLRWPAGKYAVRTAGGLISLFGLGFLFGFA